MRHFWIGRGEQIARFGGEQAHRFGPWHWSFGGWIGTHFAAQDLAKQRAAQLAANRDRQMPHRTAFAPDVVDHRMVGGGAAIAPLDAGALQNGQIFTLKQHAGRETGVVFVIGRLEREGTGSAEKACEHGDWRAIEGNRQPFQLAALCCTLEGLTEQRCGSGAAGHGGTGLALPAARFKAKEGIGPIGKIIITRVPDNVDRSQVRKPVELPPQFLALLAAE